MTFLWEGELDNGYLTAGEFSCRAERIGNAYWWCAVYRGDQNIFHSSVPPGRITSGEMARAICEAIVKAGEDNR